MYLTAPVSLVYIVSLQLNDIDINVHINRDTRDIR